MGEGTAIGAPRAGGAPGGVRASRLHIAELAAGLPPAGHVDKLRLLFGRIDRVDRGLVVVDDASIDAQDDVADPKALIWYDGRSRQGGRG